MALASSLPNRDERPRPPMATALAPEDLTEEAIFLKLRMTFERPPAIEGTRWYEMLNSFARRKAAEIRAERGTPETVPPAP